MIKNIKILLVTATSLSGVAASCLLTGCINSKEKDVEITSLKSGLKYMSENKNFSLTLQGGSSSAMHTIVYTDTCMGIESDDNLGLTNVYFSDKQGTYQINYNGEEFVGSEYRTDKNVWDTKLFPTFMGIGDKTINKIKDDIASIGITDKDYKILFATLITGDSAKMLDINSISASYSNKGITFNISYQTYSFIYLAAEFGTASSSVANEYVDILGKTALEVDYDLACAREGILGNNFKQDVYQYGDDDSSTGYVYEYSYHEHYFIQKSKAASYISGYISLRAPEVVDGDNPHPALEGIYLYNQDDTGFHLSPMAYSNNTNLIEVMNYPSLLSLWDNLHLVKKGKKGEMGGFSTKGTTYYVDDAALLADASNNLMSSSSFDGQKPTGLVFDIVTNNDGIETFTIYYQFKIGSYQYCYPFPFYAFGKVDNKTLNTIYEMYHTL